MRRLDIVTGKTIERKGGRTMKIQTTGSETQHITVVLGCTAAEAFYHLQSFSTVRQIKNRIKQDSNVMFISGKNDRTIRNWKAPERFIIEIKPKHQWTKS